MNILFYGAGVIGSIYAAGLSAAGHTITMLARERRLEELRRHGIVLEEAASKARTICPVGLVETLEPSKEYDLVIVPMRKNQVPAVLPILARNHSQRILFMVNNPSGPDEWVNALGRGRVLLGFPAAGGYFEEGVVKYKILRGLYGLMQMTTIGEVDGILTPRVRELVWIMKKAGFPATFSRDMNAWQKTHVALICPVCNALNRYHDSNYKLAKSKEGVTLTLQAIREGFTVLERLAIPITPSRLKVLLYTPYSILVPMFQEILNTRMAEVLIAGHARNARDESQLLAQEFQALIEKAHVPTPAISTLAGAG